jgi:hypothetical protein
MEYQTEFNKTKETVLKENEKHNAESIINTISNRLKKLETEKESIVNEINKKKSIDLALEIESKELLESGNTFTNSERLREIFLVRMNNQVNIGFGLNSIDELEARLEYINNEIKNIESKLNSFLELPKNKDDNSTLDEKTQDIQNIREQALKELLAELKLKNPDIDINLLPVTREWLLDKLKEKSIYFKDMELSVFGKFITQAKKNINFRLSKARKSSMNDIIC